jgi:hypothetical protein
MNFVDTVPSDIAAKWLGQSTSIAGRHYLAVRYAHFDAKPGGTMAGRVHGNSAA